MQRIKKGDTVQVIAGRDKGKRGKVLEVIEEERKIRVDGIFVVKRHLRAGGNPRFPNGGIIDKPALIDISNVKFYSEKLGRPVRVGFKVREDGNKVRVARGAGGEAVELD
jgi:large subunit ribosomal protein L24